jgi:phosphoribosyl 1,2-cyclic phosphodiesterase
MLVKVWGCRGSLPTPGPHTLKYGGNTTCLEVKQADGPRIIIDAGSGMRLLGQELAADPTLSSLCLMMTHAHWDHLMGFPFFLPAYLSRFNIHVCGGPQAQDFLRSTLAHQLEAPFFPVDFSSLNATLTFGCGMPDDHQDRCPFVTNSIPLSHPNGGYGFRFTDRGRRFVLLTDNELGHIHTGGRSFADYVEFCRGADLLFHDAQYTEDEYKRTRGWGHSTFGEAVELALQAGVKRLGLFHHDPDRTDEHLDEIVAGLRATIATRGQTLDCFAVAEGAVYNLHSQPESGEGPAT